MTPGHSKGQHWSTVLPARGNVQKSLSLSFFLFLKGTIYLLEVDFIHLELGLKDSRSQDAAAQQVLKQNLRSRDLTQTNQNIINN